MSQQQYAISEYLNVDEIYARLDKLIGQPMRPVRREKMQAYLDYFETKCKRSKELNDEACQIIPGGVQHNLAFNYPFPIAVEKADGAYLWDVDGNRYIDFLQAGGPTMLGSNYAPVREKVFEMLNLCGPVTGLFHEYELKLAQLIQRFMPSVEMFRMLGSGTESVMAAIRAGANFHEEEICHQGWRRVSWLERPDGVWSACPRHGSDGSERHTSRSQQRNTGVLSE